MKTWVKLYTEINHDPKIGTLSWAHRGILSALFALCGEIEDMDADGNETGALDTPENLAWRLRCDQEELDGALAEFQARKIVHVADGVVYLTHYAARQARPPSAKREAVRRRVREWREDRQGCNDVTPEAQRECNDDVTRLDKIREDTDTDAEENDAAGAASPRAHDDHGVVDHDLAEVYQAWEDANPRRQVTPLDAEKLALLCQEHGPPAVRDAIKRANAYAKPYLAYIESILTNRRNGKGKAGARASPGPGLFALSEDDLRHNALALEALEANDAGQPP